MHNETAATGQQAPSRARAMCHFADGDEEARVGGSGPDEAPVQPSRSTVRVESEGEGAGEEPGQVGDSRNGARKRKRDKAETAEDALLPHEPLARVMRRALKPTTHLERAAVQTVQKCVSELVMVVVGEATEHCLATGRRSLSSQDILWALRELGLEVYTQSLQTLLDKFRAQQAAESESIP